MNPKFIQKFDKKYAYQSDSKAMRNYHYSVREESPFNERNRPPIEYLMDIGKIGKVAPKVT